MGAFDIYRGTARCPACGDVHFVHAQTKAFAPRYHEYNLRDFSPGRPQPLGYTPSDMLREPVWLDQWWRVREHPEPGRLALLVDLDETFGCTCGRPLAPVLTLALDDAARTATLIEVALHDALSDDIAAYVDLADSDRVLRVEEVMEAPPHVRAARLRRALRREFEGHERWMGFVADDLKGATRLVGSVRCEACGTVRERTMPSNLTHEYYQLSMMGDGWKGGAIRPGVRVATPMRWRAVDEDRADYLRLRHPLPEHTLTISDGPQRWGCGCGSGPASVIARFAVDDEGFTLESLSLRVLRSLADLEDVDLAWCPSCSRGAPLGPQDRNRPTDRAAAVACLRRSWKLAE